MHGVTMIAMTSDDWSGVPEDVAAMRSAIEHEPLNESAHRELMTCWSQLGETARAVRHYTELTTLLKDRVGVPPATETTALYDRLTGRT